jgi:hypothetical protein
MRMHDRGTCADAIDPLTHDLVGGDWNARLQPPGPSPIQGDFDPGLVSHENTRVGAMPVFAGPMLQFRRAAVKCARGFIPNL